MSVTLGCCSLVSNMFSIASRCRHTRWDCVWSSVVDSTGRHAYPPRVRGIDQLLDVSHRPVVRMDVGEVSDVIAAVAQRRAVEGQQPDAVDAEPLEVVELLGQAAEVADPVPVGVKEAPHVDLVEDGALE